MMDITLDEKEINGSSNLRDRSPYRSSNMHEEGRAKSRERDRDRHRRGDRPSRFQDRSPSGDKDRGGRRGPAAERRVYISNIPYEYRWQDLKDLFRAEVGEVEYVELFADEGDKPKGCGIIEFSNTESVKKAVEKMHRFEVRGRKLVVKENVGDFDIERELASRMMNSQNAGRRDEQRNSRWNESPRANSPSQKGWGFLYGLSPAFLESLAIKGPLVNRVFVANLDYKVDEKKLEEVFKLAGKVNSAELNKDKEGKSRGHGVVEYEHPVEAVQAISMLHHQMLYDRHLTVRMDRVNDKVEDKPPKLPEGLRGIGMGLGEGGRPLQDVSRSLPANLQNAQMQSMGMAALQNTGMSGIANQAAALSGISGMGNIHSSVGMGFSGTSAGVGGLGGVMGSSLGGNLGGGLGSGLGGGLAGLGGGAGGIGGMLGSSMGQGGGDLGLGSGGLGVGGLGGAGLGSGLGGTSGLGSGGLSAGNLGAGFGGTGNTGLGGLGGSLVGSNYGVTGGGIASMSSSGSFLGSSGVGGSSGFGMGNPSGQQSFGNRSFDMQTFGNMDERDFRSSNFNNGQIKMESDRKVSESDTVVLAPSVTWQMLRDKFREFGDVKFAEIRNKDTGLVRFATSREAQRAAGILLIDGLEIKG